MSISEKMALAARMHVMLLRKTGRVTDTEWMACNHEYAEEIIRFAFDYAEREHHDDLAELAQKMANVMQSSRAQATYRPSYAHSDLQSGLRHEAANPMRYIGGTR